MRKLFATIIGLIKGEVSIKPVGKSFISKTPGDVTEIKHQ
jgi:hypothetical protein